MIYCNIFPNRQDLMNSDILGMTSNMQNTAYFHPSALKYAESGCTLVQFWKTPSESDDLSTCTQSVNKIERRLPKLYQCGLYSKVADELK